MIKPPAPANESERLAALRSYEILDTPPEESFDDLAKLAAYICGTPVALVTLVDEVRQWFKARVGVEVREMPRDVAFCAHGILQSDLLVVPDATKDARFAGNPLVTGDPRIRFYAGAPLITGGGYALGMVCVIDQKPHDLTPSQQEALRLLAGQAVAQLELRKRSRELQNEILERKRTEEELRNSEERFRLIVDGVKDYALLMLDPEGFVASWNTGAERIKGWKADEIIGQHFSRFYLPEAVAAGHPEEELRQAVNEGRYEEIGWRMRKDGSRFLADVVITPIRGSDGTLRGFAKMTRDITRSQQHEEEMKLLTQRLSLATRTAGVGVWDWDIRENKIEWDETMYQMHGLAPGTAMTYEGMKSAVLLEDMAQMEAVTQQVISEKGRGEAEFRIRWPNGSIRQISAAMSVALDKNLNVIRVVGANLDITEQKRGEDERDKIIAELQELLMQVKTLSGLIPICGWCKSVRADTGYWQTVEQYVRLNTSATFSHGICPSCAVKFKDEIARAGGIPPEKTAGN